VGPSLEEVLEPVKDLTRTVLRVYDQKLVSGSTMLIEPPSSCPSNRQDFRGCATKFDWA
jgi:hypothetical protein